MSAVMKHRNSQDRKIDISTLTETLEPKEHSTGNSGKSWELNAMQWAVTQTVLCYEKIWNLGDLVNHLNALI
jgi:hypothetical protein